jgi:deoxycytidylate deaminase
MSDAALKSLLPSNDDHKLANSISDRLSQELVFALVGPVASGVSTASTYLTETLTNKYRYRVADIIKMSDFIRAELPRVKLAEPPRAPLGQYIRKMQDAGNALREKFGRNYLVEKAIEKIFAYREAEGGFRDKVVLPGRRAYIIDSLKNAEELELLRQIYGDTLCLIGVFAPDMVRKQRLKNSGAEDDDIREILERDEKEVLTFGQQTRDIFVEADFFICNDRKPEELRQKVERFLDIVFDAAIHTPNTAEMAMFAADAAAANSACMSRQVGVAIVSETGELISVGRNDVPKFKGGLYTEDDQSVLNEKTKSVEDQDHRCFKWQQKICHNDSRRNSILNNIAIAISKSGLLKPSVKPGDIREVLAGTGVENLTEFSRSIHAEMEAILAVAREGRHSLVGATLYTTTYPCHNCARHIVAAGITSTVYIQPYKKSLAIALHGDAITEDVTDNSRVVFRQYDGVAPRNYHKLFRPSSQRKKDGKVLVKNAAELVPVFRMSLDSPVEYEAKVIAELEAKEQNPA